MEDQTLVFKLLSATAFMLLALATIGVAYLTVSGWRDRRRQENERRELAMPGKQTKQGKR
ncbi:MAG: hypothetical protein ACFB9N_17825 [Geitlerinemataceae cyanobacterium]